eukprot:364866-Chlamydomonas_euryale.AAC.4
MHNGSPAQQHSVAGLSPMRPTATPPGVYWVSTRVLRMARRRQGFGPLAAAQGVWVVPHDDDSTQHKMGRAPVQATYSMYPHVWASTPHSDFAAPRRTRLPSPLGRRHATCNVAAEASAAGKDMRRCS